MVDIVSIADRVVKYMENIYGEKVNLLKKDLDDYEFHAEDLNRIKYYVGDLYDKKILLYKSDLTIHEEPIRGKLLLLNYEDIINVIISNKTKIGIGKTYTLINIFSFLPEIYKSKRFLCILADHSEKSITKGLIAQARLVSD